MSRFSSSFKNRQLPRVRRVADSRRVSFNSLVFIGMRAREPESSSCGESLTSSCEESTASDNFCMHFFSDYETLWVGVIWYDSSLMLCVRELIRSRLYRGAASGSETRFCASNTSLPCAECSGGRFFPWTQPSPRIQVEVLRFSGRTQPIRDQTFVGCIFAHARCDG